MQAIAAPKAAGILVRREYPRLETVGADASIPMSWVAIKAEWTWFRSETPEAARYHLYVVQPERQWHDWLFLGGYTGEYDTRRSLAHRGRAAERRGSLRQDRILADVRRALARHSAGRRDPWIGPRLPRSILAELAVAADPPLQLLRVR